MDWLQEIQQQKYLAAQQLRNSFVVPNENPDNGTIEKGVITDRLGYGYGGNNKPFEFTKTGAELKAGLPSTIAKLAATKTTLTAELEALKTSIGFEPLGSQESYMIKDFSCKRYTWDQYNGDGEIKSDSSISFLPAATVDKVTPEVRKMCYKYNDICYNLISVEEDIHTLNIIVNNVDEKKKYVLSVSQMVALQMS